MRTIIYLFVLLFISGCTKIDPRKVEIDILSGYPEVKTTEFNESLRKLGMMAEIYGEEANVMLDKISDNTGTSIHTKAEIPYDVTEMTASALNLIGGSVTFVPYRPDIMLNLQNLGYQNFNKKISPSIIVTGGITEFDRGLASKEEKIDSGYDFTSFGNKSPISIEYSDGEKESVSRITLDFNIINIETMSGAAGVQAINTIEVKKGIKEKELAFTLLGPTIGLKGEVKKVEGRHAAIRLLVQASMMQLIGKYLDLPYWRLIQGCPVDSTVENYINRKWVYQMNDKNRAEKIQEFLFLHGYKYVEKNGNIDGLTIKAINNYIGKNKIKIKPEVSFELYKHLYYTVPLDDESLHRRYLLILKEIENRKKSS